MTLAKTILRRRVELDLSIRKVSEISGISRGFLSTLEMGKSLHVPSISTLRRLATALQTSAYELELLAGHLPQSATDELQAFLLRGHTPAQVAESFKEYE